MKNFQYRKNVILALPLVMVIFSACGQVGGTQIKSGSSASTWVTGTGTGSGGGSSTTTTTIPSTYRTGLPPMEMRVGATGYTNVQVTVPVGKILRVKFIPGIQDEKVAGTGFLPQYSKLGVYIGVGSYTQPTPMLSNGLSSGDAEESSIVDFSTSFTKQCNLTQDPTCRQNVTITISKPNNDYWCLNYNMYCPYAQVHSTHPWHGTLKIETDDTDSL